MNERRFRATFPSIFAPATRPSQEDLHAFWTLIAYADGPRIAHQAIRYMVERRAQRKRWVGTLERTNVPLRLIAGALDPVSGRHMAERYQELVPAADVAILDEVGHCSSRLPKRSWTRISSFGNGSVQGVRCVQVSLDSVDELSMHAVAITLQTTLIALAALPLLGCWPEPGSPEGQLRALFAEAEKAAEARDTGALKDLISEHYADRRGRDQQAIVGLIKFYFSRHKSIHLLTRIGSPRFLQPTRAQVTAFVAMAGQPIPAGAELSRLRADLHRFDFELVSTAEGEWKVTRAEWRRAQVSDFL